MKRLTLLCVALLSAVALTVPTVGQADHLKSSKDGRTFYATDNQGNLLSFSADNPRKIDSSQPISGLPTGVTLRGIDFRPATGELYGVGSDSVVYRVSPVTGKAVAEGPAFTPGLNGRFFGVDFNPTVDRIRVTSDANQNLRLVPDTGALAGADANLNPNDPTVVGSAYTNSSFSATPPASTVLYALDALDNALYVQNPPNNGTLTMPTPVDINVRGDAGFDIAGKNNVGYVATAGDRRPGAELYRVNVQTGDTRKLGQIGRGSVVITGLAAVQDLP
jgi:Domain of unknown function (DUF4394)